MTAVSSGRHFSTATCSTHAPLRSILVLLWTVITVSAPVPAMRVNDVKTKAARSRRGAGCLLQIIEAIRLLRTIDMNCVEWLVIGITPVVQRILAQRPCPEQDRSCSQMLPGRSGNAPGTCATMPRVRRTPCLSAALSRPARTRCRGQSLALHQRGGPAHHDPAWQFGSPGAAQPG